METIKLLNPVLFLNDEHMSEDNQGVINDLLNYRKCLCIIRGAIIVKDIAENYTYEFADDEAFRSFLQITKESSFYDTGVEPDLDSKIVTLSTCTKANNDERLVVHGMLVEVKN